MNEEIKEILDKLKETADYPKLNYSSYDKTYNETIDNVAMIKSFACKQLLDYITNLQEQQNQFSSTINELARSNVNLQKEISRLNNVIDELEKWLSFEFYEMGIDVPIDEVLDKLKSLKEGK